MVVMKRLTYLLSIITLTALPLTSSIAQEAGEAAMQSSQTGRQVSWRNWIFAGAGLVAVAIGITVIALNQGNAAH